MITTWYLQSHRTWDRSRHSCIGSPSSPWGPSRRASLCRLTIRGTPDRSKLFGSPGHRPWLHDVVKGHRPIVGSRDCKDLLYVLAVVDVVTGVLHTNMLESPARAKQTTGQSKTRRLQEAFAAHLRHIGRTYPAERSKRVVLIIDNAPWHCGQAIAQALADNPHLEFKRLPSYSPRL